MKNVPSISKTMNAKSYRHPDIDGHKKNTPQQIKILKQAKVQLLELNRSRQKTSLPDILFSLIRDIKPTTFYKAANELHQELGLHKKYSNCKQALKALETAIFVLSRPAARSLSSASANKTRYSEGEPGAVINSP